MEMNIELDCTSCVASVFMAISEFIRHDDGPSCILAVDVFDGEDGSTGAVIGWDVHPTKEQITLFRNAWDAVTPFSDSVILHDAPSSIVSHPRHHANN